MALDATIISKLSIKEANMPWLALASSILDFFTTQSEMMAPAYMPAARWQLRLNKLKAK
jgi:hypothetical protein